MARDSTALLTPRRIIALAVLAVFIVFIAQNRGDTTVELLLFELSGPLWLLLLVSFLVGGAVAWLSLDRRRNMRLASLWRVARIV